jgi:arginyl-tRNA synthetase
MGPCPLYDKTDMLPYAMVMLEGSKMKSSDGVAVLIDELLERLHVEPSVLALVASSRGAVTAAEVVDILIKVYLLAKAPSKQVAFAWEPFTQPRHNPGWSVARAWCRARNAQRDLQADDVSDARQQRWLLVLSEDLDVRHARSLETRSFAPILWILIEVAERYLECDTSIRIDRVAARVLQRALRCIGIAVPS